MIRETERSTVPGGLMLVVVIVVMIGCVAGIIWTGKAMDRGEGGALSLVALIILAIVDGIAMGGFFMIILKIATLFSPMKVFLPVSALMFLTGLGYGLMRIFLLDGRYGPTSAMLITMSVVVFMVGLVSEQVAQMRFDRSEILD